MLAEPAAPDREAAGAAAAARDDPGFRPDPAGLVPHGLTDRARRNLAALDTLDQPPTRGVVTDADRERAGAWTGWGALPQLFDPTVDRVRSPNATSCEQRLDAGRVAGGVGVDAERPLHRPGRDRRRVGAVHAPPGSTAAGCSSRAAAAACSSASPRRGAGPQPRSSGSRSNR